MNRKLVWEHTASYFGVFVMITVGNKCVCVYVFVSLFGGGCQCLSKLKSVSNKESGGEDKHIDLYARTE